MFYSCLIFDSDKDDGNDDYYYVGFLEPNGDDLIISCETTASLCYELIYNNKSGYKYITPFDAKSFVDVINDRFANSTWAIFSHDELRNQNIYPAENFDVEFAQPKLLVKFNPFSITTIEND